MCIYVVLRHAREYFVFYGDVTIARELGLCSALKTFEQGSLSCQTCYDFGPRFSLSLDGPLPDSPNLIAFYDKQRMPEDLF